MRLPIIAALDTDHDGVISEIEIAGAAVALKKLDRNKDGKIDREEMLPRRGGRGPGGDAGAGDAAAMLNRMMDLDKNSDGFLSGSEIRERMKPMVERADENGDGKLSREEIKKAMGSRPAMMRRGGGGRPGGDRGADAPGGEKPRRPPAE
jgi:Ca2+-binding EF-hand superfamily protein